MSGAGRNSRAAAALSRQELEYHHKNEKRDMVMLTGVPPMPVEAKSGALVRRTANGLTIECQPQAPRGFCRSSGRAGPGSQNGRYRFDGTGGRVPAQGMSTALALQLASVPAEMTKQATPLHLTTTVSRMASDGTPRRPSSRRSLRVSPMASARLCRPSSLILS